VGVQTATKSHTQRRTVSVANVGPTHHNTTNMNKRRLTMSDERLSKAAKASEHIALYMPDQTLGNFHSRLEIVEAHMTQLETVAAHVHWFRKKGYQDWSVQG